MFAGAIEPALGGAIAAHNMTCKELDEKNRS